MVRIISCIYMESTCIKIATVAYVSVAIADSGIKSDKSSKKAKPSEKGATKAAKGDARAAKKGKPEELEAPDEVDEAATPREQGENQR